MLYLFFNFFDYFLSVEWQVLVHLHDLFYELIGVWGKTLWVCINKRNENTKRNI